MIKDLLFSMIAIIILSGTLTFVCLFLWFRVRKKYLLDWTIGWGLYCLHFIPVIISEYHPGFFWLNNFSDILTSFSVFFLLFGVLKLRENPISKYRRIWIWPILNSIWSFYWNLLGYPRLAGLPTAITFGLIQMVIGVILIKQNSTRKYTAELVLGWSMFLWGLHKFDHPIVRHIPQLAPVGYLVGSLFAFISTVAMLLLMIEETGQERDLSTERLSTLLNYTKDIVLFVGIDGGIIDANQAALEKYGYSKEELLSLNIFHLCRNDDRKLIQEQLRASDAKGISFETLHYCKNGSSFPVEIHSIGATLGRERIWMSIIHDITERKQAESIQRKLNFTDSLTGLPNRRYLEENLNTFANTDYLPISVVIGDMNGLKLINDAFGHKTGDQLLKEMARLLLKSCSPEDLVIRWGGDEFLLFLPNTNAKAVERLCDKIKQQCQQTSLAPISPSIALGYAIKETIAQDILEVFKLAENRMYRNKLLENDSSRKAIILSLQNTLFERSYETEQHAERLKRLAFEMGRKIGLAANQMDDLALLATLHDIGKLAIPEEILSKPGPLSPEEWSVMKKHPDVGHRIIQDIPDLAHIAEAILAHHEHWDGSGYPNGLKGTEIPLIARILSIIDSYDAMTNKRVYREAVSHEQALAEIAACAGSQFDPDLAKLFIEMFNNS